MLALLNSKSSYQCKVFCVHLMEMKQLFKLCFQSLEEIIKAFLEQTGNNRYDGTKVFIQQPRWDLTPPNPAPPLLKLFSISTEKLFSLLINFFENFHGPWATNICESADCFFSAGHIPFQAHEELGFPVE